ncbi:nucleotidyltransferase domain-containing protein [Treponema primitia]|uniref:nucleotidyltransferase domain-containing protein n=1 Tax=Treponema primitia TaxID=88058 RepID=UPI0005700137|nr:nucleotidyltransferase domain-containing protein [Treponema primitia]
MLLTAASGLGGAEGQDIDFKRVIPHNNIMNQEIPYLNDIISIICSLVSPDGIILFGSYARGDNKENSDIDLLILKRGLKNEREMTNKLYKEFFDKKIHKPVDLLAIDNDKYVALSNEIGLIYKTIKNEGQLIYGTI